MLTTVCVQDRITHAHDSVQTESHAHSSRPPGLQGSHYSALTRLHMMSSTLKKVVMVNTCIPMYRNTTVSVGIRGGERGVRRLRGGGKENKEGRKREEGEEGRRREGGGKKERREG